jgi:hypothetical protein
MGGDGGGTGCRGGSHGPGGGTAAGAPCLRLRRAHHQSLVVMVGPGSHPPPRPTTNREHVLSLCYNGYMGGPTRSQDPNRDASSVTSLKGIVK